MIPKSGNGFSDKIMRRQKSRFGVLWRAVREQSDERQAEHPERESGRRFALAPSAPAGHAVAEAAVSRLRDEDAAVRSQERARHHADENGAGRGAAGP